MKTIALANQKGGVGKPTTAASLGRFRCSPCVRPELHIDGDIPYARVTGS